jgi:hypothetical protein
MARDYFCRVSAEWNPLLDVERGPCSELNFNDWKKHRIGRAPELVSMHLYGRMSKRAAC